MYIAPPTYRLGAISLFLASVCLIIIALIMQHLYEMEPCPLCITQRVFIIGAGLVALLAAAHNPKPNNILRKVYPLTAILLCIIGAGVSARHVWLQSLPPGDAPACGPGLQYMFEAFPLMEALELLFKGDGNCADVVWSFLGLSIPAWTLVAFIALIAANIWQCIHKN